MEYNLTDFYLFKNCEKKLIDEIIHNMQVRNAISGETIFNQGITNIKGEYVTSTLPVGLWDFRSGYDDVTFDI